VNFATAAVGLASNDSTFVVATLSSPMSALSSRPDLSRSTLDFRFR